VAIQRRPPRAVALWHQTTRTALVVDDEPLVRSFMSTALRRRGWSVIEAADGPSALAVAPETLDLLVTDYEMPTVTGLALAQMLRQKNRGLPVVMVSGHPNVAGLMDPLHGPRTAFVTKPFPVEELISTVGAVTR
jgi:CheY-like chemotaxis protein